MWSECDRQWRGELWRHVLDMLPVEVMVNLLGRGFSVRRREGVIYADSMNARQYERMLAEWSELLDCRELAGELGADALRRRFARGERDLEFALATCRGPLRAIVRLGGDPSEEPFVIRLEADG